MSNKIKIKRGLKTSIPTGDSGEPLWTTDSHELFIGTSAGNIQIANKSELDQHTSNFYNPHQSTLQQITSTGATTNHQIISTVISGIAPFSVVSSTGVSNLNADLLDGYHAVYFEPALTKGNLTGSIPLHVSGGTGSVIGTGSNITIDSATTTSSGIVRLSNNYVGTSQILATTEKALSDGLGTKENSFSKNTAFNKNFETSTGNIKMDGAVSVGALSTIPRADHIHPTDTSREPALTKGNMTATSPIITDNIREVIGGAVVFSHSTSTGYIHLPSGGSSNQILKNSGSSGTGAWGTVTENAGALDNITTINMAGVLTSTLPTGIQPLQVVSSTGIANLNADLLDGYHATHFQTLITNPITGTGVNGQFAQFNGATTLTSVAENTAFNKEFETSTGNIKVDGSASVGASGKIPHSDHVHGKFTVQESDMYLNAGSSVLNATSTTHGFLLPLSNSATQYLNGQGNWVTPTTFSFNDYSLTTFSGAVAVVVLHNFNVYPIVQVITSSGYVEIPYSILHDSVNQFTVTFTAPQSGSIIASVGSPQPQSVKTITTTYIALPTDRILTVTNSGITVTLYTAIGYTGYEIILDNASSGNVTLLPHGSEKIEKESSQTIPSDSAIRMFSNGSGWRIY